MRKAASKMYKQLGPLILASGELQALTFTTLRELEQLAPAWRELHARCPDATPFQGPDWLISYARCFGVTNLLTLALFHRGELVGLAPCLIYKRGEERVLSLLGGALSDYQNVLFAQEHRRICCDAWITWLHEQREDWDRCEFEQVPPRSALHARVLTDLGPCDEEVQGTCPTLHAFSTGLVAALPASLAKNLRYTERKLHALGALRFERADAQSLSPLLAALSQLHAAPWHERGATGSLSDEAVLAFHNDVAAKFLAAGSLRLYALRLNERVIAVFYGFCERNRFYYYLGGFDPKLAKYSPGALILEHAIREADREAAHVFEFLRGAESYKYLWGARDVWVRRITVAKHAASQGSGDSGPLLESS